MASAGKGIAGLSQSLNSPDQSVNRHEIFISYATSDRRLAQDLCRFLQDNTYEVFLDVQDLSPGTVWLPALREALEASRAIVVLVSPHANDAFYRYLLWVAALGCTRSWGEDLSHSAIWGFCPQGIYVAAVDGCSGRLITDGVSYVSSLLGLRAFRELGNQDEEGAQAGDDWDDIPDTERLTQSLLELPAFCEFDEEDCSEDDPRQGTWNELEIISYNQAGAAHMDGLAEWPSGLDLAGADIDFIGVDGTDKVGPCWRPEWPSGLDLAGADIDFIGADGAGEVGPCWPVGWPGYVDFAGADDID